MHWSERVFVIAILVWGGAVLPVPVGRAHLPVSPAERSEAAEADTIGPSIKEAREMIVGTWIEDVSDEIGTYTKGPKKWVFTEDGTLKKYRRTDGGPYQLDRTVQWNLVNKNPETGQEASNTNSLIAYLKTTESDGDVEYSVLTNVNRSADPSYLVIDFTGATITSVHFKPPSAFN